MMENIGMAQKRLSEATKKRLKAGRMLLAGKSCTEVALAVGVARQTVHAWKGLLDEGGIDALRAVPELWTLKRVGAVIERLHGVRFGQTQVWRILGSLGFSPQKPAKRAIERKEDAVRGWKRSTWPSLKKKPSAKAV